jgi:negative regulator of replication initiation
MRHESSSDLQKRSLTVEASSKTKKTKKAKDPNAAPSKWGTTVRISWQTHDFIKQHGLFGESFDDVLKRLLKL